LGILDSKTHFQKGEPLMNAKYSQIKKPRGETMFPVEEIKVLEAGFI
jgi:hypothetical protein